MRGWWLLIVGLLAALAVVPLAERDLVFVAVVSLAVVLLAAGYLAVRSARIRVAPRLAPARVQVGEGGSLVVALTNQSARRTAPLEVTQPAVPHLVQPSREITAPLRGGETRELVSPFVATRRGRFRVPAPQVRLVDPFGLWQVRRLTRGALEVVVLPSVVPLAGLPLGLGGRAVAGARAGGGGDPDVRLRPYREGDDLRTVHWRASARLEEDLLVRAAEPSGMRTVTLLVDTRAGAATPGGAQPGAQALETLLTLAASVGVHLLEQDVGLTVVDQDGAAIATGHDVADELLVALAAVDGGAFVGTLADDGDASLSAAASASHRRASASAPAGLGAAGAADVLVVLTSRLEPVLAQRLLHLARPGMAALALAVTPRSGPEQVAGEELLREGGWRVVSLTSQADPTTGIAEAWAEACTGVRDWDRTDRR